MLVRTTHKPDFTQRFYYLQSDKATGDNFWRLYPNPGFQINAHIKSVKILSEVVAYGSFDDRLPELLSDPLNRTIDETSYFPFTFLDERLAYYRHKELNGGFYHKVPSLVLNEPEAQYKHISIQTEDDVFVRSGLFKHYIPQLYQDTCAMTGMRMWSTFKYNFIGACHILLVDFVLPVFKSDLFCQAARIFLCEILLFSRVMKMLNKKSKFNEDKMSIAETRVRYGMEQIVVLLKREGWRDNPKRITPH